MTAADRIRKGFWRIALIGLAAGGVGAALAICILINNTLINRNISVFFEGSYLSLPRSIEIDAAKAVLTKKKWDYLDEVLNPETRER